MDELEITKIAGAIFGAFLVFMLMGWAAEVIYHTGGGHGGEEHAAGYVIEVEEAGDSEEAAEEGPSLEEMMASADIEKGAKVFGKCKSCHKLEEGGKGTGPYLYGVVDRAIAAVDGYGYSGALSGVEGTWSRENLNAFLTSPKAFAPGNKMSFGGLKKPKDRANLISYLESVAQ